MDNLLVFGGTFDPFHNGHYKMLEIALSKFKVTKVVLVPNYLPVNKKKPMLSSKNRFSMLNKNKHEFPKRDDLDLIYDVSDYELNQEGSSYTINTLKYLQEKYNSNLITLLIGSDNFFSFHLWKDYADILKQVTLCVINRGYRSINEYEAYIENNLDSGFYKSIVICENEPIDISSTKIKENFKDENFLKINLPKFIYNELITND